MIEPRHRLLFVGLFGVFMVFGTSMTIIGAALPNILTSFGWNYLIAGMVLGANAVAYFTFTFVGGYTLARIGPKPTILAGMLISAAGLLFFASTPSPLTNILLGALIGVGQGFVEITVNWATLRLDIHKTSRPMNLMHGAFALGAILGPLALGLLLQFGFDWITVYRVMSGTFATLALFLVFLTMPAVGTDDQAEVGQPQRLGAHPAYWLSFLALFFYVGVELGVSNWLAEYFVAVFAYPAGQGALLVSLYWIGLLAGRFGVPILYTGAHEDRLLVIFSALSALAVAGISALGLVPAMAATSALALVLVFLAGFGASIYYPVVITLLGACFPRAQSQAIGFAATGGGVGAFAFPFLMSALAQGWGIRTGFAAYAVFGLAMTLAALALVVAVRRPFRVSAVSA